MNIYECEIQQLIIAGITEYVSLSLQIVLFYHFFHRYEIRNYSKIKHLIPYVIMNIRLMFI